MKNRDKEIEKISNSDIKRFEKVLEKIEQYEKSFLDSFDNDIQAILGDIFVPILEEVQNHPELIQDNYKVITLNGKEYKIPNDFLIRFHKSFISDVKLREEFENRLKNWFSEITEKIRNSISDKDSYDDVMSVLPQAFAIASIALTSFHKHPNMILRDVQKMTGIAICEGNIAELGTGEGKTLSAVLPAYLQALRGKGVHIITANGYLAKRDYDETLPIFEGLGLTSGFLPESEYELAEIEGKKLEDLTIREKIDYEEKTKAVKQKAYRMDITYGSKQTFAFDYLRDNNITSKEDMIQREIRPGFAIIDEVDDVLIDDAEVPYIISIETPMYEPNMSLRDLCTVQNISYEQVLLVIKDLKINPDSLTYEEAKYISDTFGKKELLPNPSMYQEAAQLFFESQNVFYTKDKTYGFETAKEVFRALLDEDKYDAEVIREKYGIIVCEELRDYKVSDKCFIDFLNYCYMRFQINSEIIKYQDRIKNKNKYYMVGRDFTIDTSGKIRLTDVGAKKVLEDEDFPELRENYQKYISGVSEEARLAMYYLQQAIVANVLMKNGEDYIVERDKVKTLKNGRIQEGSTYSNGLHQAIEFKEKIPVESRTREASSVSTITQKDFYSRYDMFSGMTGTSSKDVFSEIFGKKTIEIPKHAFYSFFGRKKQKDTKEPTGIERRKTEFTLTVEEKIKLIVDSIIESQKMNPKQPVLLVVSDVDELELLQNALRENNIYFATLTAETSKEDEALIIARAGLPGMVTLSTEMAGRGTDIRIGGDRDTIIDIATERAIRTFEKQRKAPLILSQASKDHVRTVVENKLLNSQNKMSLWTHDEQEKARRALETTGLKVISSGFFNITRIDRQLEGRTGRNGISGVCERFVCPKDMVRIGLSSLNMKDAVSSTLSKFSKKTNGALDIDDKSYEDIMSKVEIAQKNNEANIKERIKQNQKFDNYATRLIEEYRDQRRKIFSEDTNLDALMYQMIENATDAILSSYILDNNFNKNTLTRPLNKDGLQVEIEAISLEVKQILGISFDYNVVIKSNINFLELRDAIIRTAMERYKEVGKDKCREALLAQNDYMIANIPIILEHSFSIRNLNSLALGMEERAENNASIEFGKLRRKLELQACKQGVKQAIGLPLTMEEYRKLNTINNNLFDHKVTKKENKETEFEVEESEHEQNNNGVIQRFKAIKAKVEARNKTKIQKTEEKITRMEAKGQKVTDTEVLKLYSKLDVRPLKFISIIVNNKPTTRLALVRREIIKSDEKETLLR